MIQNNLSAILGEKRMKKIDLARLTGLNSKTIYKFYYSKSSRYDIDTIDKICAALSVNTQELLEYVPD